MEDQIGWKRKTPSLPGELSIKTLYFIEKFILLREKNVEALNVV